MPEQAYFDDPALGSGDMRALLQGAPAYWWQSPYNPNRKDDDDTPSLTLGKAIHKLVLEGGDAFDHNFVRAPHDDSMTPGEKSAATKDLKKRLAAQGRSHVSVLPPDAYDRAIISAAMITRNPGLKTAFQGGIPEVSVFWTRGDGIRRKARIDYLKPRGVGDLKSAGNYKKIEFPRACREAIANMRYEIQAAHYLEARANIPRLFSERAVFGELKGGQHEIMAAVIAEPRFAFQFVFYATTGAPIACSYILTPPPSPGAPGNPILQVADREIERAAATFTAAMARFGPDSMWVAEERPEELTVDLLPKWWALA